MDIPNIPGLGFHPTDDELLTYYLKQRILDHFHGATQSDNSNTIPDIELYSMHPKELPRQLKRLVNVKSNGREWVFFCARKEKYRNSSRSERTVTGIGYWKVTSKAKDVKSEETGNKIGTKNILTFYERKIKTDWIMHEYHLNASCLGYNVTEMPFVVCRLYNKGDDYYDGPTYEDQSTESATSQTYGTSYQHNTSAGITSDEEMWQSLPQIQPLPHNLSSHVGYGFTRWFDNYSHDGAGSSSYGGFYNGNDSNSYFSSNVEPSYYDQQQYQGGWDPSYN